MADSISLLITTSYNPATEQPILSAVAKGCGYFGAANPAHTVQYALTGNSSNMETGFAGMIKMQGTLVENHTEADWFDIDDTTTVVETPLENDLSVMHAFIGGFVWVRANILISSGSINHIQYSHS